MAFMQWDDQYSVRIKVIDDQHQRLFVMIQDFYDQMRQKQTKEGIADILKGLADYSQYHFNSEEALMTRHSIPTIRSIKTNIRNLFRRWKSFVCVLTAGS